MVPASLFTVLLTNLSPAILLVKAVADRRRQRFACQRIFIKSVQLDPHQNTRGRAGVYSNILGTAKYQPIDEHGGVYRLCAASKRSLFIHAPSETEAEAEYLQRLRIVPSLRPIPADCKRLSNNPAALLECARFFADYIRQ